MFSFRVWNVERRINRSLRKYLRSPQDRWYRGLIWQIYS